MPNLHSKRHFVSVRTVPCEMQTTIIAVVRLGPSCGTRDFGFVGFAIRVVVGLLTTKRRRHEGS